MAELFATVPEAVEDGDVGVKAETLEAHAARSHLAGQMAARGGDYGRGAAVIIAGGRAAWLERRQRASNRTPESLAQFWHTPTGSPFLARLSARAWDGAPGRPGMLSLDLDSHVVTLSELPTALSDVRAFIGPVAPVGREAIEHVSASSGERT